MVHVSVPPLGLFAMARVTGADDVVTTLPSESSTDTPVVNLVPEVVVVGGCVVTTSEAGAPGRDVEASQR